MPEGGDNKSDAGDKRPILYRPGTLCNIYKEVMNGYLIKCAARWSDHLIHCRATEE